MSASAAPSPPRRGFRVPGRIAVRLALYFALCWIIVGVLAAGMGPLAPVLVAALALYTTVPLVVFLRSGGWPRYPGAAFRLLVVRPFWYVQLVLPLVAAAGAAGMALGAIAGDPLAWGRIAAGAVAGGMSLILLAGYLGSLRLRVRRLEARIPGLAPEHDGLTIGQITDVHVGPHLSRRALRRVRRRLEELDVEVIAVVGDMLDDRHEDVDVYAAAFGSMTARIGVFLVAGNHDVYAGWDAVEPRLRAAPVGRLLLNESQLVRRAGSDVPLAIVGVGDPAGRQFGNGRAAPDVERALAAVPRGTTVVALAHNPALWPSLAKRGVALTLSGHTHWGQLAIPALDWSLASPFLEHAMGVHRDGRSLLYVSPGTGYWGIPFRIGARAEVTHITLRRSDGDAAIVDITDSR